MADPLRKGDGALGGLHPLLHLPGQARRQGHRSPPFTRGHHTEHRTKSRSSRPPSMAPSLPMASRFMKTPASSAAPARGVRLANALGNARAIVIRGHGSVVVAENIKALFLSCVYFERNAQRLIEAYQIGSPQPLPPDEMARDERMAAQEEGCTQRSGTTTQASLERLLSSGRDRPTRLFNSLAYS